MKIIFQCRENFDCFQREGEDLKWKMLMVIINLKIKNFSIVCFFLFQRPEDHLLKNQEYNREGYLFLVERSISINVSAYFLFKFFFYFIQIKLLVQQH